MIYNNPLSKHMITSQHISFVPSIQISVEWFLSNLRSKHPSSGKSDWLDWGPRKL